MCRSAAGWLVLALLAAAPARALTIRLTFDPTHPASTGPFSAAERQVVEAARDAWQAAIPGGGTVDITVVRSSQPGARGLLGLATAYQSSGGSAAGLLRGVPTGGLILIDDRTPWFVDGSPGEHSEFGPDPSHPGAPPTYLVAAPGGPVGAGRYDLLTVALHEMGHVLGLASAFENFARQVQPSPDTPQQVYVFDPHSPPPLGDPIADYRGPAPFSNGGVYLPQREEDSGEAGSVGGVPSHLDHVDFGGTSAGLFPFDLMNEGIGTGERRLIAPVDLDILADAYGYAVVPEPGSGVLVSLGLLALARLRRRPRTSG